VEPAYAMNEAGLERNENIFRFTNPKGRLRNRLGEAAQRLAQVRFPEARHMPLNAPLLQAGPYAEHRRPPQAPPLRPGIIFIIKWAVRRTRFRTCSIDAANAEPKPFS
jgi:hypothetical protein